MDRVTVQECKSAAVQRYTPPAPLTCTLDESAGQDVSTIIRNPKGRRSDLVVSPRSNGGLTIRQGPSHVLISARELGPLLDAITGLMQPTP